MKNALTEIGAEFLVGNNIRFLMQQNIQVPRQRNHIEQVMVRGHFNQDVDIAIGAILVSDDGAENTNMSGPMPSGDSQNLLSILFNFFHSTHVGVYRVSCAKLSSEEGRGRQ